MLTETAEERLQAIKEFTELGSGFKIVMRDLNIRGAGNLLGKQQHGFIDSVGFVVFRIRKRGIKEETRCTRSRNGTQLRCLFTCRIHSK